MVYIWVGLGGLLGAVTRFLAGQLFSCYFGSSLPYGTLLINITGSMLLGMIQVMALERLTFSERIRQFSAVGFCGAYTTFSTFTKETLDLLQHSHLANALLYTGCSVFFCLLGAWFGMVWVRVIGAWLSGVGGRVISNRK